jgi:hypothetical protein
MIVFIGLTIQFRESLDDLPYPSFHNRFLDKGTDTMTRMRLFFLAVLVLGAISRCFMADRLSGEGEARKIRALGRAAQAKVLKIWDTGITVNNDPVVGFLLEVRPNDRPPYQAETKALISRLDIPQIQPGAVLPVKFDPDDPGRVALDIYVEE